MVFSNKPRLLTSTLLRILLHLCSTLLLSSLSFLRFDFSLYIRAQTPPVPYKRLCQDPAIFTPTAIWTVIRFPSDLSCVVKNTRFDCIYVITTLPRLFIFIQLPGTHFIDSPTFSYYAQYHSFWLQHQQAAWNLHLNADFERPTLISYKTWFIAFIPPPFVAISSSGHTLTLTILSSMGGGYTTVFVPPLTAKTTISLLNYCSKWQMFVYVFIIVWCNALYNLLL